MAPVAAGSRPPGRPKRRTKVEGRPELPALYTARNLDKCTRQLGHWNPFASSAAASPEPSKAEGQNPNSEFQFPQQRSRGRDFEPLPALAFKRVGSERGVFEFGSARVGQERRWSKCRKQLSHALARGLWRWKDGFHARKRMKRCGPGGGRNSGSSSDRAPYGVLASDPSTAPTSKAGPGPFKWSDFTDSSGELFNYAGGGSLMSQMNALGKDWTTCGCSRGDGRGDCDHCWVGSENQNVESGYGSEPGYRGDEELEFGDADEQDEEETEPQHLRMWAHVMAREATPTHDDVNVQAQGKHGIRRTHNRSHVPL